MAIGGNLSDWQHGTNGAPTVLTDNTGKTQSVVIDFGSEEVDATVFGDSFREFEQSFKNATIQAVYKHDTAIWTIITDIYTNAPAGGVNYQLGPDGTTTGKPKITGSMILSPSFSQPIPLGELLVLNVGWRVTGAVTFGTFA